jgi:iron(II)-dependent oxidoreductase
MLRNGCVTAALFNGDGFESWENVWGTWTGITQRDGEQIRRVGAILRFLGGRGYLQSQEWVPHSPTAAPGTLFASEWPMGAAGTAWTVVNRDTASPHVGPAINVSAGAAVAGGDAMHFYDLWFGKKIEPPAGGQIPLSLEARGYGAVLATPNSTVQDAELAAFLTKMQAMQASGGPIQKLDANWTYELQTRVPIAPAVVDSAPPGMVEIPGGAYRFVVRGIEIEGSGKSLTNNPFGVDFQ